jgi:hypothetical protein
VIIWVNGPFGVGKTTTVTHLRALIPDALVFDTETIGYSIRPTLAADYPVADFQDWPVWRESVVAVLASLDRFTGRRVIVPQTVVVERYWTEIADGLAAAGVSVAAFTLDASAEEHERRIAGDASVPTGTAQWRRRRAADFRGALGWLRRQTTVIDTDDRTPADVAALIVAAL